MSCLMIICSICRSIVSESWPFVVDTHIQMHMHLNANACTYTLDTWTCTHVQCTLTFKNAHKMRSMLISVFQVTGGHSFHSHPSRDSVYVNSVRLSPSGKRTTVAWLQHYSHIVNTQDLPLGHSFENVNSITSLWKLISQGVHFCTFPGFSIQKSAVYLKVENRVEGEMCLTECPTVQILQPAGNT